MSKALARAKLRPDRVGNLPVCVVWLEGYLDVANANFCAVNLEIGDPARRPETARNEQRKDSQKDDHQRHCRNVYAEC